MRRLLHRVLLGVAGLTALGLLVAGALLVALHTDWGREKVRAIAEAQLDKLVEGDVEIGRITGSVLGRFEIHGIVVRDREGREALRARKLLVDYDLLSLLRRRVRVEELEVIEPIVVGPLDGLWKRQPLAPGVKPARGEPWAIQVGVVRVKDGLVVIPTGDGTLSLARLELDASVDVAATTRRFEVARLAGIWLERGVRVEAHGSVVQSDPLVALAGVEILAGRSRLAIPLAMVRPQAGAFVAGLAATVHEADLFPFWPHDVLLGDLSASGAVVRAGEAAPIEARLALGALGGEVFLAAALFPDAPRARGELRARGVTSPLAALPATVDVDAAFDLAGRSIADARGHLDLAARGTVMGRRIDRLKIDATVGGGRAQVDVAAALPAATVTVHGELRPGGDLADLVVEAGRLRAHVSDLGTVLGLPELDGDVELDLSAHGTVRALSVAGTALAGRLRLGTARATNVSAIFDLSGAPGDPRGFVNVDARWVAVGATKLGRIHARARLPGGRLADVALAVIGPELPYTGRAAARVALLRDGVEVTIRKVDGLARGLELHGDGGVVTVRDGGRLAAHDVVLRSRAGSVELEGELVRVRRAAGLPQGKLHVHARDLDLALLRKAFFPDAPAISGSVTADLHLVRDGRRLGADGEVIASSLAIGVPSLPPVDLTTRFSVGRGSLVAQGHARASPSARSVGVVDFALSAAVPDDVTSAAAWRRIDLDEALSGLLVTVRDVDLEAVGVLLGRRDLAGRLDGRLVATPRTRAVEMSATLRGLTLPQLHGLDARIDGRWDHDALTVQAVVSGHGVEIVRAQAKARAGLHTLLSGAELTSVPVDGTLVAADVALEKLRLVYPAMGRRAYGKLSIDGAFHGTLAHPTGTLAVRLADARVARVAFRELEVRARLDPAGIEATVKAVQQAGGSLDGTLSLDLQGKGDFSARLRASRFDLGFLAAVARRQTDLLAGAGGKLDADVSLASQAGKRSASGTLALHEGQLYSPSGISGLVHDIEMQAALAGGRVTVTVLTGKSGSGSLRGSAEVTLAEGLAPSAFTARIAADRFPVSAGSMVVAVSLDGEVAGKAAEDTWEIDATLRGTRVRVPEERRAGARVQPLGDLADVVYTDLPDFQRRTALLALTGSPVVSGDGGGPTFRLVLKTPGGVRVSGRELDLLLATNLTVFYRGGTPYVGGSVEANRGYIDLFGRRYDVLRANASFDENEPLNPHLDIRLAHEFRTTTVTIHVSGTQDKPTLELSADPGQYDQAQLLGWVLGGDPDDPSIGKRALGTEAVGLASGMLLGQMQDLMKLALPIDVLAIKVGEGSDTQTTRFEVGKWITENLFVGYTYRLNAPDDKNVNEAEVKYRIGARWLLDAFFGDRGVAGADLLWSKKY